MFSASAFGLTGSGDSTTGSLETISPTLQTVSALTEKSLLVTFSEPMLALGAATPGDYAVSGLGAGTLITVPTGVTGAGPYTLAWTTGEMRNGAAVTVTATGVQDLVGNPIDLAHNSASGTGFGVAPVFTGLLAQPLQAAAGDTVTILFTASETLEGAPVVSVNGHEATWVSGGKAAGDYTYSYIVQSGDPLGMAAVSVVGTDLAGNTGSTNSNTVLDIIQRGPSLPVYAWPAILALLGAGMIALAGRRRARALLVALLVLAAGSARAANPAVSNVTFSQGPGGAHGTQVDIHYDLVAPNGPCAITVSLSKNGGADGFVYPVAHYSGDIANVTTGTGRHIVWDIRSDDPEENIPRARLRVTANDALVQHTLTYIAGPNGTISGVSPQTVNYGASGTAVTAVANTGYAFSQWSDSSTQNPRTDTNVSGDITVTASFSNLPPVVTSFAINGGATTTSNLVVTLNNTTINSPAQYMASESSSFTGAAWTVYAAAPSFTLSGGVGARTVYFKAQNAYGVSVAASATIFLTPQTVSVAAGTFTMGNSGVGDDAPYATGHGEDPQHPVTLGAYQIGTYDTTNKQYCDVLNWAFAQGYLKDSTGAAWAGTGDLYAGGDLQKIVGLTDSACNIQYSGGVFSSKTRVGLPATTNYSMDTHPAIDVSWYGSAAFCNWLSQWQGLTPCYDMATVNWPLLVAPPTPGGYRLPTEAEWERAAAWDGSHHWIYGFTSDTLTGKNQANYRDQAPDYVNPLGLTSQPYTSPAGWFNGTNVSPNGSIMTMNSVSPAGCFDMCGEAAEWVHDWYSLTYYSGGAMTNPTGPVSASPAVRVFRGGSWYFALNNCRSAFRGDTYPLGVSNYIGFRLAKS